MHQCRSQGSAKRVEANALKPGCLTSRHLNPVMPVSSIASRAGTRAAALGVDEGAFDSLHLLDSLHRRSYRHRRKRHRGRGHREFGTLPTDSLESIFLAWLEYAVLAVGILGVLAFTPEYSTGQIRTTFAAVPHRRSVLAAKAGAIGLVTLCFSELLALISFFLSEAILSGRHHGPALSRPGRTRSCARQAASPCSQLRCWASGAEQSSDIPLAQSRRCLQRFTCQLSWFLYLLIGRTRPAGSRCSSPRPRSCRCIPKSASFSMLVVAAWPALSLLIAVFSITRRDA